MGVRKKFKKSSAGPTNYLDRAAQMWAQPRIVVSIPTDQFSAGVIAAVRCNWLRDHSRCVQVDLFEQTFEEVFVPKMNSSGTALVYSAFHGNGTRNGIDRRSSYRTGFCQRVDEQFYRGLSCHQQCISESAMQFLGKCVLPGNQCEGLDLLLSCFLEHRYRAVLDRKVGAKRAGRDIVVVPALRRLTVAIRLTTLRSRSIAI